MYGLGCIGILVYIILVVAAVDASVGPATGLGATFGLVPMLPG